MIGVDPDHQGTGLGRALTVAGLEHLADARGVAPGCSTSTGRTRRRSACTAPSASRCTGRTGRTSSRWRGDDPLRRHAATSSPPGSKRPVSRAYRLDQIMDALYRQRVPLDDATSLPRALRARVAEAFPLALEPVVESSGDDDQTIKWLWRSRADGVQVETVLMRYPTRATVCVSSQAGCAMGCTFCATGQAGFERNLDVGEIVEQVVRAAHASDQPVTNVVFMGMGEPLANYAATWAAVERLHRDLGLSARHITISTVGIVPGIRRLAEEALPVTLAISLHAPDDDLRDTMIPINRRYPLADVIDAAAGLGAARGRRVTFEYACIAGVNDGLDQARALVRLLRPLGPRGSHVNLIPAQRHRGLRRARPGPGADAGIRHRAPLRWPHGDRPAQPRNGHRCGVRPAPVPGRGERRRGPHNVRPDRPPGRGPHCRRCFGKNDPVNDFRWVNQSQPQTLYGATILCYIDAVFGLLFGVFALSPILALLTILGLAAGGFGVANEKKWGYAVAVAAAVLQLAMLLLLKGFGVLGFPWILTLMFDGLLVGLLVHPMSRDYQRIWFR